LLLITFRIPTICTRRIYSQLAAAAADPEVRIRSETDSAWKSFIRERIPGLFYTYVHGTKKSGVDIIERELEEALKNMEIKI